MDGICRLCNQARPLMHSHVLPAFLYKWMKQAGHIRHSQMPNRRIQDGMKRHWLCRGCEDIFNSFETPFATEIFHPYDRDRSIKVRYGHWMPKFCASVAWRSLLHLKEEYEFSEFDDRRKAQAEAALITWGRFLRGEYKHTGACELHVLPFDEIESRRGVMLPPNINRYLLRAVEINVGSSDSTCFVYSKIGPMAIFGFIEMQFPMQWKGTKIHDRAGWFGPRTFTVPSQLGEYISERAARAQSAMAKISPVQQRKINESLKSNIDRFAQSSLFRAMKRDVEMFGEEAFIVYDEPAKS